MIDPEWFDSRLDRWVSGDLRPDEAALFQRRREDDEVFRQETDLYRDMLGSNTACEEDRAPISLVEDLHDNLIETAESDPDGWFLARLEGGIARTLPEGEQATFDSLVRERTPGATAPMLRLMQEAGWTLRSQRPPLSLVSEVYWEVIGKRLEKSDLDSDAPW